MKEMNLIVEKFTCHPIYGKQEELFKIVSFFSNILLFKEKQIKKEDVIVLFVNTILEEFSSLDALKRKNIVEGLESFFLKDFYDNERVNSIASKKKIFKKLFYEGYINLSLLLETNEDEKEKEKKINDSLNKIVDFILLNYDYLMKYLKVFSQKQEFVISFLFKIAQQKTSFSFFKKSDVLNVFSDVEKEIFNIKERKKEELIKELPIEKLKEKMKKVWLKEKNRIPKKESILLIHPKDFDFKIFSKTILNNENNMDQYGYILNFFGKKINLLNDEVFLKLKESFIDLNEDLMKLTYFILNEKEYVSSEFLFKDKINSNQLVQLFYIAVFMKLFPKTKKVFSRKKEINSEFLNYFYIAVLCLIKLFKTLTYFEFSNFINYLNKFDEYEIVDLFYYLSKEEIQEKGKGFFDKHKVEKIIESYIKELFKVVAISKTLKNSKDMNKNFPKIEKYLGKYKIVLHDKFTLKSLFVGIATNCCQVLGGVGQECVFISAVEPNATIVTVEKYGYIYAQSYTWKVNFNGINVIVFDSVELPKEEVQFADKIKTLYLELSNELVNSGACDIVILSQSGGGDKISHIWKDFESFNEEDLLIKYPFKGYNDFSKGSNNLICLAGDISKIIFKKQDNLSKLMKELSCFNIF